MKICDRCEARIVIVKLSFEKILGKRRGPNVRAVHMLSEAIRMQLIKNEDIVIPIRHNSEKHNQFSCQSSATICALHHNIFIRSIY